MATLCVRPMDCLDGAGQAFFAARRGVRAAPGPRQPTQQQRGRQAPATASPACAAVQSRPESGGQRGRRGPPPAAEARSLPHKRAMENVVILKRGDPIPAALTVAAPAPAAELSAAGRVDQRGRPDTDEEKKADAAKAEAAPAAARQQTVPLAKEAAVAATAVKQMAPPARYSGASFAVVAPEPRALPIPVHFLKPRGRDHYGCKLAPAAAAA